MGQLFGSREVLRQQIELAREYAATHDGDLPPAWDGIVARFRANPQGFLYHHQCPALRFLLKQDWEHDRECTCPPPGRPVPCAPIIPPPEACKPVLCPPDPPDKPPPGIVVPEPSGLTGLATGAALILTVWILRQFWKSSGGR